MPTQSKTPATLGEKEGIEKAYPEAYKIARKFHELYESMAPSFGYETKEETKEFDPESSNGRLMACVCWEVVKESYLTGAQAMFEAMRLKEKDCCGGVLPCDEQCSEQNKYNRATTESREAGEQFLKSIK